LLLSLVITNETTVLMIFLKICLSTGSVSKAWIDRAGLGAETKEWEEERVSLDSPSLARKAEKRSGTHLSNRAATASKTAPLSFAVCSNQIPF